MEVYIGLDVSLTSTAICVVTAQALLRKSASGQSSPFPGHTYPAATVIGMPSAVKRLRTATRIWTSATWRSKSRDISRWPSCFTQFIFVSTLLRRWYPLQFRQSARPKCFDARRISFRARAPAVSGFQGLALRRVGSEEDEQKVWGTFCPTNRRRAAGGDGIMAGARVVGAVGRDGGDLLVRRDLGEQLRQHRSVADIAGGDLDRPHLQCFLVYADVDLAPDPALGAAMFAAVPCCALSRPHRGHGRSAPFALDLDAGAVHEQVQRTLGTAIRDGDVQCSKGLRGATGATVPPHSGAGTGC